MAVTFHEQIDSQEYRGGSYIYRWWASGSTDPGEVYQAALLQLPAATSSSQRGMRRDDANISIVPEKDAIDTVTGKAIWRVEVPYNYRPTRQPVDTQIVRVDTTGGTDHITIGIANKSKTALNGGPAPDYKGAINVDKKGVNGVDIVVPRFNFTVEICHNMVGAGFWNNNGNLFNNGGGGLAPFLYDLFLATGTYNDAIYSVTDSFTRMNITLAVGDCLYLGATVGASRSDGALEICHGFSATPGSGTRSISVALAGVTKLGWDYLWMRYQDAADTDCVVKKPTAAYVEQVYTASSFAKLKTFP